MLGKTRWDLFPAVIGTVFDTACRRAMDEGVTVRFEECYAPTGKWLAETVCPSPSGIVVLAKDITDPRAAEAALRKSEERFQRYFELGLIGMKVATPSKVLVDVNDEICRILGYERRELLQMTWETWTHPDDLAAEVRNFNGVLAGEADAYSMNKRCIRKDGQIIYTTISVKCLRALDGSVDYFVALLQDVSEHKRAEEEEEKRETVRITLARNEERLRLALRSSGIAAFSWEILPNIMTADE